MSEIDLAIGISGDGAPTLVFTHGWVDDSSVWDAVVEALSLRYRCVTWDLRGHGRSAVPPPGNYSRDQILFDLARVVEQGAPGDQPVVLVGHSLGGYLSLAATLTDPADVAGLVLIATGPGFRSVTSREEWNASVRASAAKLGVPEGSEEIAIHVDSWVIDELTSIEVPALLILGEKDKRFAASIAVFERDLNVASTVIVADAGHSVHRHQPVAVAAAIEEFVDGLTNT